MTTHAEAVASLNNMEQAELAAQCSESYKDFYNVRGRHLLQASKEELVRWWLRYFQWDEENQLWEWTMFGRSLAEAENGPEGPN